MTKASSPSCPPQPARGQSTPAEQQPTPSPEPRQQPPIFVESTLDDLPLSAKEFRVYAHLQRRAGRHVAYPSYRSIAEKCLRPGDPYSKDETLRREVISIVNLLVLLGLIIKRNRLAPDGGNTSNEYIVCPKSHWNQTEIDNLARDPIGTRRRADQQSSVHLRSRSGQAAATPLAVARGNPDPEPIMQPPGECITTPPVHSHRGGAMTPKGIPNQSTPKKDSANAAPAPAKPPHRRIEMIRAYLDLAKIQVADGLIAPGEGATPLEVYREFFTCTPHLTTIREMHATCTDLARWRAVLRIWANRGYNPTNVHDQMQVYRQGWTHTSAPDLIWPQGLPASGQQTAAPIDPVPEAAIADATFWIPDHLVDYFK